MKGAHIDMEVKKNTSKMSIDLMRYLCSLYTLYALYMDGRHISALCMDVRYIAGCIYIYNCEQKGGVSCAPKTCRNKQFLSKDSFSNIPKDFTR